MSDHIATTQHPLQLLNSLPALPEAGPTTPACPAYIRQTEAGDSCRGRMAKNVLIGMA